MFLKLTTGCRCRLPCVWQERSEGLCARGTVASPGTGDFRFRFEYQEGWGRVESAHSWGGVEAWPWGAPTCLAGAARFPGPSPCTRHPGPWLADPILSAEPQPASWQSLLLQAALWASDFSLPPSPALTLRLSLPSGQGQLPDEKAALAGLRAGIGEHRRVEGSGAG